MSKLIVNVETGETVERELNKVEKDQQKIDQEIEINRKVEAKIKAQARDVVEAKLAALGLTTDDLRALGLQPVNEALALCSWYTIKRSN